MKNVFYQKNIVPIGGIETFLHEIVIKYSNKHDITIFYETGDPKQVERLRKYVRIKKYEGEIVVCDNFYFNYNYDMINKVKAKEYIQVIHGDLKSLKVEPSTPPQTTKVIAVSKNAKKSYEELTGRKVKHIYNPLTIEKPKNTLLLLSATRLTKEKGKNRMIKLAQMLDENNIPYLWLIFTDDTDAIDNPNIVYMKPRLNIRNYIAKADYLVQLSDNEGFCYSVVEALCLGTPVIVTDLPVLKEIGVNKNNSIIVDFELENLDVNKLYNKSFTFEYSPPRTTWGQELRKGKSNYEPNTHINTEKITSRGFKCENDIYVYMESDKFKKLSKLEQEEFREWFNTIERS